MKIKLLSDLHMEGWGYKYEFHGEDIVILAGDIHTQNRHEELIKQIPPYVHIYMVAGNHEYYRNDFTKVNQFLTELQDTYPNFHFMNNTHDCVRDVHIFGGTMFTDFTLDGIQEVWFVKHLAKDRIADFMVIEKGGRPWNPQDHEDEFKKFEMEFTAWLKNTEGQKRIVITHFMPTPKLTHPRFIRSKLNPYFTQNMEKYMGWDGYWFCGHGHDNAAIRIEDTVIVMNPKGYGNENDRFNDGLILEI